MFNRIIRYFLENRVVTLLLLVLIIVWGISTSPFNWHGGIIPRNPIPVDAIPDIGDNQQIVATEWMGRSPKDIQDQITYPLTTSLLGIPGVKTIRSSSMFGMSFIYIIFDDDIEFYWSRSRILEKLNPCLREPCRKAYSLPWDRTLPPSGRSIGIRWKDGTPRPVNLPEGGMRRNCVRYRISTSSTPYPPPRGYPRLPRRVAS